MTKCYIHIGMEKTGSTSIQGLLHRNRGRLARVGVHFPDAGLSRLNHNFLASAYIPPEDIRQTRGARAGMSKDQRARYFEEYRSKIMAEIRQSERVVISGEHLFRLTGAEIARFKRDLEAAGVTEARVFCVVRNPVSFYLSYIQQELKGSSRFSSPDEFFVPYSERVGAWQTSFKCVFGEYDAWSKSQLGIVGYFIQELEGFLEVELPLSSKDAPYVNDSLSPEEMQIVQDFRQKWYPGSDGQLNRPTTRLVRALRKLRDDSWRKPVLSQEVAALISARHRHEIVALDSLIDVNLATTLQASTGDPIRARDVRDVIGNFKQPVYERLQAKVRPARYADIGVKLSRFANSLIGRGPGLRERG